MPVRCHVPGRLRPAYPGPHDVLPVPQAPVRAGRAGRGAVLPGSAGVRVRGAGPVFRGGRRTGTKIAANASAEASRTEAGLRKLAGQVITAARGARILAGGRGAGRAARRGPAAGRGYGTRDRTRGRGPGRAQVCPAGPASRAGGRRGRRARAGAGLPGRAGGRQFPPEMAGLLLWWPSPRRRSGWSRPSPPRNATLRTGRPAKRPGSASAAPRPCPAQARKPAGPVPACRNCRPGRPPKLKPGSIRRGPRHAAAQHHRPRFPADASARRRVHPGIQLPGRRGR